MGAVTGSRILKMAIAGALGGVGAFAVVNPGMAAMEETERAGLNVHTGIGDIITLGVGAGVCIGVALALADELQSRSASRLLRAILVGGLVGAVIGVVGAVAADLLFGLFTIAHLVVIGRTLGWALFGAAAGLCPGVASGSARRALQGLAGGLIGGAIGGLLFDALAAITGGGAASRAVGFLAMGAAIGAASSLIEEMGKESWLIMLNGAREGRTFILNKSATVLGRYELSDVPLFGDASVLRRHAVLAMSKNEVTLRAEPGAAVVVNGHAAESARLLDGDEIAIGRHRLRFRARTAAFRPGAVLAVPNGEARPRGEATAGSPTALQVLAGPVVGQMFPIVPGAIIGRDPRCDVPLAADSRVSRQHARLVHDGVSWFVEDGGSPNGTRVNGQPVVRQVVVRGDEIGVGDSVLRVV